MSELVDHNNVNLNKLMQESQESNNNILTKLIVYNDQSVVNGTVSLYIYIYIFVCLNLNFILKHLHSSDIDRLVSLYQAISPAAQSMFKQYICDIIKTIFGMRQEAASLLDLFGRTLV